MNDTALKNFIAALTQSGFKGDIESGYAERIVASTDNSIYQVMPDVILYPRVEQDINRAMRCTHEQRHEGFSLVARGAATGTNGQSLGQSIILDCSRHLTDIVEFDADLCEVTVQPGVVLDQLNAFLKPHGLFFPIDISTSSRATLGGMVATDASGKGSLIYGKTSNHIQSLDVVLADGSDYTARVHSFDELGQNPDYIPDFLLPIALQLEQERESIQQLYPELQRGLSGYNLQQCMAQPGYFNPCYLLAGSEGTLGISKRIKLKVVQRPAHRIVTVIFYRDFNRALEHTEHLLNSQPAAIEMLDDKILNLAQQDSVWLDVKKLFAGEQGLPSIKAVHYVEHVGHSSAELTKSQQQLHSILSRDAENFGIITYKSETEANKIAALWQLRKRAVGLLGKSQQGKRGVAFVEDSAVPPSRLVSYITGFRQILDKHGLAYGMYGHADAGVLHVRPTLDLLQLQDRELIRTISDRVAQLALDNHGVLWGEHGRGYRGEYTALFFGEKLYALLCEIKSHFDPNNLLNSGKLVPVSSDDQVTRIDAVTMRGELDQQIPQSARQQFNSALDCNGNASCHSWNPAEAMCPSYKATGNKSYSPKGRAAMLREWLRLKNTDTDNKTLATLESSLFESLQHCLSCKSCSSSCPLQVDIPGMKSQFLEDWYQRHHRPLSSIFIRHFESLIAWGARMPRLFNRLIQHPVSSNWIQKISRLNHLPEFSSLIYQNTTELHKRSSKELKAVEKAVILLRDNYMNSFDRDTLQASINVLSKLGYRVYLSRLIKNGKLLHVKGYRAQFKKQAARVVSQLQQLAATELPLISSETMTRLLYGQEYAEILGRENNFNIYSIESFLNRHLSQLDDTAKHQHPVTLLPHCMEQTSARESSAHWQSVFESLGVTCQTIHAGCCGMSGLFGHEVENNQMSEQIFNLNWNKIASKAQNGILLASGFSCRCQLKNHHYEVKHPIQYVDQIISKSTDQ